MRKVSLLSILFISIAMPSLAVSSFWKPDEKIVKKAEVQLGETIAFSGWTCPAQKTGDFARHYYGFTDAAGHQSLHVQLVRASRDEKIGPGIYIENQWAPIADGGCSIANASFDADTLKLTSSYWGGR